MISKIINFIKERQSEVVLAIVIVLITITSFNLGRMNQRSREKTPVTLRDGIDITSQSKAGERTQKAGGRSIVHRDTTGAVVASKKSSSKLYHFSWCPGASKIASQNLLTFPNEAAAITAGFHLAANCTK